MRKAIIGLLVLTALIGCGDDDPVTPGSFSLTIRVTDPQGNPVPGLDLSLAPDTPFYQDALKTPDYRPAVAIPFQLEQESNIRLTIEDIEGNEVRLLHEDAAPMGVHHIVWNGLDDNEERLASGVYKVHLVARHPGNDDILLDQRQSMLMAILDASRYSVGITNASGRIVLKDQRLFPHLYDQAGIPAVDENADQLGTIQFTPSMRFQLFDLTNGGSIRYIREISGSGTLELEWNIEKAIYEIPGQAPEPSDKDQVPPAPSQLGQPYPCPFN